MSRRIFFLWMPLLLIMASGCSKKSDGEVDTPCFPYTAPHYLVKEILSFQSGQYTKSAYFYDTLDRLVYRRDSGENIWGARWKYGPDTVFLMTPDSFCHEMLVLNEQGYAIQNIGTLPTGSDSWEYDGAGYVLKSISAYPIVGITIYEYGYQCWNRKLATKFIAYDINHPIPSGEVVTYEHFTDKISTIGLENIGIYYMGKQDNCLLKREILHTKTGVDTLNEYTYEFDALNRVVKEFSWKSGEISRIRSFQYWN